MSASRVVHDIRKTVAASSSRGQRALVLGMLNGVRVSLSMVDTAVLLFVLTGSTRLVT
jgi:hypothetical protein